MTMHLGAVRDSSRRSRPRSPCRQASRPSPSAECLGMLAPRLRTRSGPGRNRHPGRGRAHGGRAQIPQADRHRH